MRRGSSWSASWSTKSPVSLQSENSESAEMEDRLSTFSSGESISVVDSLRSKGLLEEERVWRGILAGLRGFCENGGILSVSMAEMEQP
jgi:hypothetical protein